MPDTTPCRFCGRIGFVHVEHVMTARESYRQLYCGACDRTWKVDEKEEAASPGPPVRPKKKRKKK